jgi:hypothetical protein
MNFYDRVLGHGPDNVLTQPPLVRVRNLIVYLCQMISALVSYNSQKIPLLVCFRARLPDSIRYERDLLLEVPLHQCLIGGRVVCICMCGSYPHRES